VKNQVSPRSYIIETQSGKLYRRNRQCIIKTSEPFYEHSGIDITNY